MKPILEKNLNNLEKSQKLELLLIAKPTKVKDSDLSILQQLTPLNKLCKEMDKKLLENNLKLTSNMVDKDKEIPEDKAEEVEIPEDIKEKEDKIMTVEMTEIMIEEEITMDKEEKETQKDKITEEKDKIMEEKEEKEEKEVNKEEEKVEKEDHKKVDQFMLEIWISELTKKP